KAAHGPAQGHGVAEGLDGDLAGIREARIARELRPHFVDDPVVGDGHCSSPCPPPEVGSETPARGRRWYRTHGPCWRDRRQGEDDLSLAAIAAPYDARAGEIAVTGHGHEVTACGTVGRFAEVRAIEDTYGRRMPDDWPPVGVRGSRRAWDSIETRRR